MSWGYSILRAIDLESEYRRRFYYLLKAFESAGYFPDDRYLRWLQSKVAVALREYDEASARLSQEIKESKDDSTHQSANVGPDLPGTETPTASLGTGALPVSDLD